MVTPAPGPEPLDALTVDLPVGHQLYRVHGRVRGGDEFNPGLGSPTRFAFFGDPPIPVLYAADTEVAAVCESLLHAKPLVGAILLRPEYEGRVASRLVTTRLLRFASLMGAGLRRLGLQPTDVTDTPASAYPFTVRWAEAASDAGFDGLVYMSRKCNSDRAYVLFDGPAADAVQVDSGYQWDFGDRGPGRDKLTQLCATVKVEVLAT